MPASGGTPRRLTTFNSDQYGVPIWSPDGQALYVVARTPTGASVLYRVPVDGGAPRQLQVSPNARAGVLSPDGSQWAYGNFVDGWAYTEVTPTAGGEPRRLTRRTEYVYQTLGAWSPDGTRLVVEDWTFGDDLSSNVLEISVGDTTRTLLTTRPQSFEDPWAYTPDGRHIVYVFARENNRIMSVSVAGLLAGR